MGLLCLLTWLVAAPAAVEAAAPTAVPVSAASGSAITAPAPSVRPASMAPVTTVEAPSAGTPGKSGIASVERRRQTTAQERAREEWVWPPWAKKKRLLDVTYPQIAVDADWLEQRLGTEGPVVLDVRSAEAYARGHVPGALRLDLEPILHAVTVVPDPPPAGQRVSAQDPAAQDAAAQDPAAQDAGAQRLDAQRGYVLVGDVTDLPRMAAVFWGLKQSPTPDVWILQRGMEAWRAAGGALETGAGRRARLDPLPEEAAPGLADAAYVARRFGEEGCEILDVRGEDAWGTTQPPHANGDRAGHIPHSLPFEPQDLLADDGWLPEARDLRRSLSDLGPRPGTYVDMDAEFLVYDVTASPQAALAYLLLRVAAIPEVRIFRDGWQAWSRDARLPVVRIIDAGELRDLLLSEPEPYAMDRPPRRFVFFDVRNAADFSVRHLPGAVSLPSHLFADSLDVVLERHWPDCRRDAIPLVVYCYGVTCIRSRLCGTLAAHRGFLDIRWYRDGIEGWQVQSEQVFPRR